MESSCSATRCRQRPALSELPSSPQRPRPILGDRPTSLQPLACSKCHSPRQRSEEHTSELQSLMRISYAVFCLKKKKKSKRKIPNQHQSNHTQFYITTKTQSNK